MCFNKNQDSKMAIAMVGGLLPHLIKSNLRLVFLGIFAHQTLKYTRGDLRSGGSQCQVILMFQRLHRIHHVGNVRTLVNDASPHQC